MTGGVDLHPLSAFLRPWFCGEFPPLSQLNDLARKHGLKAGSGAPLSFVAPDATAQGYEKTAYQTGEIATRPNNRHDMFNALIWLAFPQAKAALNRRHFAALSRVPENSARGPLRDALTQFDECGVVVAGTRADLWQLLCAHRWREVFVERRAELLASTHFLVFGHASHDALTAPFVGLCGKALFIKVDAAWLRLPESAALAALDAKLAAILATEDLAPRDWQPLPLLGIPGATVDSENPDYYADARQFRPARTMRPGSSPGNRWARKCLEESPGPIERNAG